MSAADKTLTAIRQHVAAGRFADAEAACRHFLRNRPRHAETLNMLGGIQCQLGHYADALETTQQALAVKPADATLRRNLAYLQCILGQVDESIENYRNVIDAVPLDYEAHHGLGLALQRKGMSDEAAACFKQVVELQPGFAPGHKNLADSLRSKGQLEQAKHHYVRAIQIAPGDVEARNALGVILTQQGQPLEAIALFEEVLRLSPEHAEAENNLSTVLRRVERIDEAVSHAENAVRLQPNSVESRVSLGAALRAQGNVEAAVAQYEEVLRIDAGHVIAHNNLGFALVHLGDFERAIKHLEEALRLDPNYPRPYHSLGTLAAQGKYEFTDAQIKHIRTLLNSDCMGGEDASVLHFTLASDYDKKADYSAAFSAYERGNSARQAILQSARMHFDQQAHQRSTDESIAVFDRDFLDSWAEPIRDSELPIFVVGMPRSGTTLIEQIISSHPEAAGAGELRDFPTLVSELPTLVAGPDTTTSSSFPTCLQTTERASLVTALNDIAGRYLEQLATHGPGAKRIVDKMWANYAYLGLITILFPRARIIHCRRNAMDVCLSCFMRNFSHINWTCRLEDIGLYYNEYERLMGHWRATLPRPSSIYEVTYEELVSDQEAISRELIDFCGLPWDDRCLDFHKSDRSVRTASSVQVRQPIYKSAVERWKRYEPHLEQLRQTINHPASSDPN